MPRLRRTGAVQGAEERQDGLWSASAPRCRLAGVPCPAFLRLVGSGRTRYGLLGFQGGLGFLGAGAVARTLLPFFCGRRWFPLVEELRELD
jgi:hypothetical protein